MIDIKCKLCNKTVIFKIESQDVLKDPIVKGFIDVPCSKCVSTKDYIEFFTSQPQPHQEN